MLTESGDKTMDESRQGEAIMVPPKKGQGKKLLLESYGCAMNFSDSEIVASILEEDGFATTRNAEEADVILLNTCSIREKAEDKIRNRLLAFKKMKRENPSLIVGVLGCMAERLKETLLEQEKLVDLVVGPDAYRELPNLIEHAGTGQKAVNVLLSREETYAEISPVRLNSNGINAYISIMRGCDNMCSFCVVPFTRGRERSRNPESIVNEAKELAANGYKEVTLLGQNVDSYKWNLTKKGEVKEENLPTVSFSELMEMVAKSCPELWIRFSTSHPKDLTDDVAEVIAKYDNICNYIHLPIQSGNNEVLKKMNRGYTREWYLNRIEVLRRIAPECAISTDIITGFCGETEEQHADTLSLMAEVSFDMAYMFKYSERPKTLAERKYDDDIPEVVKGRRLSEVIDLQRANSYERIKKYVGTTQKVLVEGPSKKSEDDYAGRTSQNSIVVFPKGNAKRGTFVKVRILECTSMTLKGELV